MWLNIILGVGVRVFLDEVIIQISRLSETGSPVWVAIVQSVEDLNKARKQRKGKFTFFAHF